MTQKKHLSGEGEVLYDDRYDILTFKVKDRKYKKSVEFQNFVIDIDREDFVSGLRIFDASKVLNKEKNALKNIFSFAFKAAIENNVITVAFTFTTRKNKQEPLQEMTQQITTTFPQYHLSDCSVECQAVA